MGDINENTLPEGWREVCLGDVCEQVSDKINSNVIKLDNYISTENMLPDKMGIKKASSLPCKGRYINFKEGDVLFSNIRTYFKKIWLAKFEGGASNDIIVFRPKDLHTLNNSYLYYLISHDTFIDYTVKSAKGTKMPRGDKSAISNFLISLPPINEQKKIANLLSSFDNKIELLEEQNKTLEEIAQTIFKEWFGKYQLGDELPEGWRIGKLEEFILQALGGDYGKETIINEYSEQTICLRGTDLHEMRISIPSKAPIRFLKKSKLLKCELQEGDIVIEISGGTENQSTGRVAYIDKSVLENFKSPLTCVNFCKIIRLLDVSNVYFIYSIFDFLYKRKVLFNWENGTTGIKNLDFKGLVTSLDIILPKSNKIISDYNKKVEGIFVKIQKNNAQMSILKETRDKLLPKLMNGSIRL